MNIDEMKLTNEVNAASAAANAALVAAQSAAKASDRAEEASVAAALISNDISYIKRDISEIKTTLKEFMCASVTRGEHEEVVRVQADHEGRTRILEESKYRIVVIGGTVASFVGIAGSYLLNLLIHS